MQRETYSSQTQKMRTMVLKMTKENTKCCCSETKKKHTLPPKPGSVKESIKNHLKEKAFATCCGDKPRTFTRKERVFQYAARVCYSFFMFYSLLDAPPPEESTEERLFWLVVLSLQVLVLGVVLIRLPVTYILKRDAGAGAQRCGSFLDSDWFLYALCVL